MTLDDLHELGRTNFAAAWRAALAWTREGRTPELDWDDHGKTRCVNIPATWKHIDLSMDRVVDSWINPAWRWYHGDNHELVPRGGFSYEADGFQSPTYWVGDCLVCHRQHQLEHSNRVDDPVWFGLPKPRPLAWDAANHLSERFAHVRDHAWLEAIRYEAGKWTGTLREVQANMPEWPVLFAFHLWTAAWLARPEAEQLVYIDHVEALFVGDACRGRACEAKE